MDEVKTTNGAMHSKISWSPEKSVISHFSCAEEGMARLGAVGLNTVPSWLKPYHVLSTGQKARAILARTINNDTIHDEFTSMLDRHVAYSLSVAVGR